MGSYSIRTLTCARDFESYFVLPVLQVIFNRFKFDLFHHVLDLMNLLFHAIFFNLGIEILHQFLVFQQSLSIIVYSDLLLDGFVSDSHHTIDLF
jgi:hypothetical protein